MPFTKTHFLVNEKYIHNADYKFHFYITNKNEYNEAESIIENFKMANSEITPVFNGKNIDFFQDYIFLEKEDILGEGIQMKRIFANQKLNTNFFGRLHIVTNGDVSAISNTKTLGNIENTSILALIYNELIQNTAWRLIRNKSICSECHYKFLCPPINNYEFAIGKPNLCTVIE